MNDAFMVAYNKLRVSNPVATLEVGNQTVNNTILIMLLAQHLTPQQRTALAGDLELLKPGLAPNSSGLSEFWEETIRQLRSV